MEDRAACPQRFGRITRGQATNAVGPLRDFWGTDMTRKRRASRRVAAASGGILWGMTWLDLALQPGKWRATGLVVNWTGLVVNWNC